MLDPFSALSIAAAVAQFLDFGSKLIAGSIELYRSAEGVLPGILTLETITDDLKELSRDLSAKTGAVGGAKLSKNEMAIQSLANACVDLGFELEGVLQRTKLQKGSMRSWESFRRSFHIILRKSKIIDLEERLGKLQGQLQIRLVSLLSDSQSSVLTQLTAMEKVNTRIQANTTDRIGRIKIELENAVLAQVQSDHLSHNYLQDILEKMSALVQEGTTVNMEQEIIESLSYKFMELRRSEIDPAHVKTFLWVFEGTDTSFRDWLEARNGIFWVSGKAGSGKSTLMKYLAADGTTRRLLAKWAGTQRLVIASHYFWSSGSPMQRSLEGLLQHLLSQILRNCPEMIPAACSDRWVNAFGHYVEPWTLVELTTCFEAISTIPSATKFCLFIDGLDEYEGDHFGFIKTLQKLTLSPSFKVVASSRPWNVFSDNLGISTSQLCLHELTRSDITQYVNDMLRSEERFTARISRDPETNRLIQIVVDRASGVFLWVQLVVKKLLEGLSEGDDIHDLHARLDALPPRLEDYFKLMIKRIDGIYRERTAQVFRLTLEAIQPQSILIFTYAQVERQDADYAMAAAIQPLPKEQVAREDEDMRRCLNKWCRDFLDVKADHSEDGLLGIKVHFIHRTARDFLATDEMHKFLLEHTSTDFDPRISLCKAILAVMKTMPVQTISKYKSKDQVNLRFGLVDEFMCYAMRIEQHSGRTERLLIDELDGVNCFHAVQAGWTTSHWTNTRDTPSSATDGVECQRSSASSYYQEYGANTFLASAIQARLSIYVAEVLSETHELLRSKRGRPLLDYALRPAFSTPIIGLPISHESISADMVHYLLDQGADPNELVRIYDNTVWGLFLKTCCRSATRVQDMGDPALHRVIETLILRGADPDLITKYSFLGTIIKTIRYERKLAPREEVSLSVIEALSQIVTASRLPRLEALLQQQRKKLESERKFCIWKFVGWT